MPQGRLTASWADAGVQEVQARPEIRDETLPPLSSLDKTRRLIRLPKQPNCLRCDLGSFSFILQSFKMTVLTRKNK